MEEIPDNELNSDNKALRDGYNMAIEDLCKLIAKIWIGSRSEWADMSGSTPGPGFWNCKQAKKGKAKEEQKMKKQYIEIGTTFARRFWAVRGGLKGLY